MVPLGKPVTSITSKPYIYPALMVCRIRADVCEILDASPMGCYLCSILYRLSAGTHGFSLQSCSWCRPPFSRGDQNHSRARAFGSIHRGNHPLIFNIRISLDKCDLVWPVTQLDRKSTRLNSSHSQISYAVFCLKKKK